MVYKIYKMYKKYLIDNSITSILVCGDLHGCFDFLLFKLKLSKINNTAIIFAGDCGFGFEKKQYYINIYNKFKDVLIDNNIKLYFLRGNHDDKSYFDGEMINFDNFILIPDYSVIQYENNENPYNILCIGGAISIDRVWRKNEELRNGKKLYWTDEIPVYEPEILNNIKKDGINISIVVTHTSPHFAPKTDKDELQSFIIYDNKLDKDLDYERSTLTQIYDHVIKNDNHPVKIWLYGHFHDHKLFYSDEDIKFVMIDTVRQSNNTIDLYEIKI